MQVLVHSCHPFQAAERVSKVYVSPCMQKVGAVYHHFNFRLLSRVCSNLKIQNLVLMMIRRELILMIIIMLISTPPKILQK